MADHVAEPYTPTFSPKVRTGVYVACLFGPVLTALVCTILAIAAVIDATTAAAVTGAVGLAAGSIAGGMGVAYRPTRPDIADSGIPLA